MEFQGHITKHYHGGRRRSQETFGQFLERQEPNPRDQGWGPMRDWNFLPLLIWTWCVLKRVTNWLATHAEAALTLVPRQLSKA